MDERSLLITCFGIGIALEALLMQRADWRPGRLLGCIALSLAFALPGKHERVYEPLTHVLLIFSGFSVMFALAFSQDILPAIGERMLLSYTMIFWFAFLAYFYHGTGFQQVLAALMLIPTIATVLLALWRPKMTFTLKLIFYTWFLCLVVGLGLLQFPFYQLKLFVRSQEVPWVSPQESISAGMAFLYLLANATYIFYLIPIPGKHQSMADRMKQWHAFTDLMTLRFDDDVSTHRLALALLGAQFLVLLLDLRLHWIPRGTLINALIVLPSALAFARRYQTRGRQEVNTA